MSAENEYSPSPWEWVRNQVEEYEASGGTRANTLRDTGLPIIVVTTRGARSGAIRKTPLMRVEHDGEFALVASMGGAPQHPLCVTDRNSAASMSSHPQTAGRTVSHRSVIVRSGLCSSRRRALRRRSSATTF